LNGGPSRWYQLYLDPAPPNAPIVDGVPLPFTQIATDGNILTGPVPREFIRIGVARRDDVVIDFSKYKIGDQVFLTNRLQQIDGRGPVWDPATGQFVLDPPPGTPLLRFDVDYDAVDNSRVPETLRELPDLPDLTTVPETIIAFNRLGSAADPWSVRVTPPGGPAGTDFIYDGTPNPFLQQQPGGSTIWNLQNNSGLNPETWTHPIHHHLEESRILSRQVGVPGTTQFVDVPLPPEDLGGRKDVIELPPRNRVRIFFRFREFHGKYLLHCHNTVHEDHAMMARWDVVP
ncbi:MAG: multicopper oxidase domain-containing protein, partial [Pyrinomonadaceae bacterium]